MLAAAAIASLSFSMPTADSKLGRRELWGSLASGAFTVAAPAYVALRPAPVYAQKSKMIPKSSKEMTEKYKEYKYSGAAVAAGSESAAFKAAEARRGAGGSKGPESAEDQMKRLGLRTYTDAVAAGDGYDECSSWRGCNRK